MKVILLVCLALVFCHCNNNIDPNYNSLLEAYDKAETKKLELVVYRDSLHQVMYGKIDTIQIEPKARDKRKFDSIETLLSFQEELLKSLKDRITIRQKPCAEYK